jgi:hypothetical protein
MAKKKRINPFEWVGDRLRYACGSLSKDARILITIFIVLTLSGLSIYFTISSIYHIGKGNGQRMQIEHIERLELELRQMQSQADSVKQINEPNYEYREFESE